MPKKNAKFYWGASTSSHQVEGNTHNSWSEWEKKNAQKLAQEFPEKFTYLPKEIFDRVSPEGTNPNNYISGGAADHYHRHPEDIAIMQELNLNAYRFSIEWSRIEPEDGQWDMNEVEHYRKKIQALRKAGIEPFVTLWHWTHPVWFEEMGGWESARAVEFFTRYVAFITRELAEELQYVIILNEPKIYTGISYLFGEWPPQKKSFVVANRVLRKLIRAHNLSYQKIKLKYPNLKIGVAENIAYAEPANSFLRTRLNVGFQEFVEHMFLRATSRNMDFVGVNYYFRNRIYGFATQNPNKRVSDLGWDLYPQGLEYVLTEVFKRYHLPVIVTENGLADGTDSQRQWWLEKSTQAIERAREHGTEIFGYLHWSLLDNFEWDKGFWPRFGLVEVDYTTLERKIRPSAKWYAKYINDHP